MHLHCTHHTQQNLILEEKYTQTSYIADVESEVYGAYISGYCGNFGVRWDDTGWSDYPWSGNATKEQYRLTTSLPIYFEGMGFVKFGTKNTAAVKDTVKTTKAGTFKWTLRYSAASDVSCVDLYVNGSKVKTLSLYCLLD